MTNFTVIRGPNSMILAKMSNILNHSELTFEELISKLYTFSLSNDSKQDIMDYLYKLEKTCQKKNQ